MPGTRLAIVLFAAAPLSCAAGVDEGISPPHTTAQATRGGLDAGTPGDDNNTDPHSVTFPRSDAAPDAWGFSVRPVDDGGATRRAAQRLPLVDGDASRSAANTVEHEASSVDPNALDADRILADGSSGAACRVAGLLGSVPDDPSLCDCIQREPLPFCGLDGVTHDVRCGVCCRFGPIRCAHACPCADEEPYVFDGGDSCTDDTSCPLL